MAMSRARRAGGPSGESGHARPWHSAVPDLSHQSDELIEPYVTHVPAGRLIAVDHRHDRTDHFGARIKCTKNEDMPATVGDSPSGDSIIVDVLT